MSSMSGIAMAGQTRPDWYATFNSPILARLAYWKAQNQAREEREQYLIQQQELIAETKRQIEMHDPNRRRPRLAAVTGDDPLAS